MDGTKALQLRKKAQALCALIIVALASACSSRGGTIPYDTALGAPDARTRVALASDLPIEPNDRLQVTVFRVPELSGEFRVGADGAVNLPLLGAVDLRNRTPSAASTMIAQLYGAQYLRSPQVTVSVLESTARSFTVEGGVAQPGVYPIGSKMDLISAIATARGINTESGNERRIAILREIGGQKMAAAFDLRAVRDGTMVNPDIYPGDIIVVNSNTNRALFRDILSALPVFAIFNPLK